jgi:hypothetical protein
MSDKSRKSMPQKEREEGGASLRQMEKLLAVSRRQLESALKAARCGLWDWPDVDKDEAWWSPEF